MFVSLVTLEHAHLLVILIAQAYPVSGLAVLELQLQSLLSMLLLLTLLDYSRHLILLQPLPLTAVSFLALSVPV
jgi:hypothetical protein